MGIAFDDDRVLHQTLVRFDLLLPLPESGYGESLTGILPFSASLLDYASHAGRMLAIRF